MTPGLVVVVLVVAAAAAASVREEAVPETGEYLPKDTFRKLAAVLYRRGDKVRTLYWRYFLIITNIFSAG